MNIAAYKNLSHQLVIAGVLPFVAGTLLLLAGIRSLPGLGDTENVIASYALVISVFLTGIHWGQHLSRGNMPINLFITSNVIAVLIWISWLILPVFAFLFFVVAVLVIMLIIDRRLFRDSIITRTYVVTRTVITGIVMTCLCITALLS
ncbi:MAG: DUF3429 domain-containing protein [Pseudohongiellaceae bacterium]|jgi:hypothetical protein